MMVKRAQDPADAFSTRVTNVIEGLIGRSGMTVATVIEQAGMSRNYYYKRARGEMPFNTNDISNIADVLGLDPFVILASAAESVDNVTPLRPNVSAADQTRDDEYDPESSMEPMAAMDKSRKLTQVSEDDHQA